MERKRRVRIANYILGTLLLVFMISFIITDITLLKALTSTCFVVAGIVFWDKKDDRSLLLPMTLIIGLVCSLFGDVAIVYSVALGALGFGIAHLFYLIAHFSISKYKRRDLLFAVILYVVAVCVIKYAPFVSLEGEMLLVGCVYAAVISCMTGKAISNYLEKKDRMTLVLAIGAFVFFLSDFMVLFSLFNVGDGSIFKNIGHVLYFPAQFVLAQAIRYYYD